MSQASKLALRNIDSFVTLNSSFVNTASSMAWMIQANHLSNFEHHRSSSSCTCSCSKEDLKGDLLCRHIGPHCFIFRKIVSFHIIELSPPTTFINTRKPTNHKSSKERTNMDEDSSSERSFDDSEESFTDSDDDYDEDN